MSVHLISATEANAKLNQFDAAFAQVAKSQKAALVPFFLKGVGDDPEPLKWFQSDRIHPNEAAQPRMLANVWPTLKKQLK